MAPPLLLFVDFTRDNLLHPTRIVVDGIDAPHLVREKYLHISFTQTAVFEFSSIPESPAVAIVYRKSCVTSFLNDIVVPIVVGHTVIGSLKVKVTQGILPPQNPIACKAIDLESGPVFIGHRGMGANRLGQPIRENTLLSFNEAMKHERVAGIELDVMLTADGQLAIFHDMLYPVTLNDSKTKLPISSLLYERDIARETGEKYVYDRAPTLGEVLSELRPDNAGIVIEIKYPTNDAIRMLPDLGKYSRTELVRKVIQSLIENQDSIRDRWIVVSSFDPDIVWVLCDALRETRILVLHNVWFGHENDEDHETLGHFKDTRNLDPAVALAQATLLNTGLAFEADYVLADYFNENFSDTSIPMFSYGSSNLKLKNLRDQKRISAFFIDDMNLANLF